MDKSNIVFNERICDHDVIFPNNLTQVQYWRKKNSVASIVELFDDVLDEPTAMISFGYKGI